MHCFTTHGATLVAETCHARLAHGPLYYLSEIRYNFITTTWHMCPSSRHDDKALNNRNSPFVIPFLTLNLQKLRGCDCIHHIVLIWCNHHTNTLYLPYPTRDSVNTVIWPGMGRQLLYWTLMVRGPDKGPSTRHVAFMSPLKFTAWALGIPGS